MRRFAVIGMYKPVLGIVRANRLDTAYTKAFARFTAQAVLRLWELHTPHNDEDAEP